MRQNLGVANSSGCSEGQVNEVAVGTCATAGSMEEGRAKGLIVLSGLGF